MLRQTRRLVARLLVPVVVAALVPVLGPLPAAGAAPPPVPDFGSGIDAYSGWDDERTCSHWEKPGVGAFKTLVLQAYPSTYDSQYFLGCDSSNDSGHQQGTAWDWGIPSTRRGDAEQFLDWLLATRDGHADALARRFGIMYIIWDHRMWRAYPKDGNPAGTWAPYSGGDPHTDHVHFSFGPGGANRQTSWWTGQQYVAVSNATGGLYHAMRRTGGWTTWGDVEGQSGALPDNQRIYVGTAHVAGQLHMLAASGGELYHAIRNTAGGWSDWGNVEGKAGEKGAIWDVAAAEVHGVGSQDMNHDLHVVASTDAGGLFHTIRGASGWKAFGDVEGQCGQLPGPAAEVAAAGYRDQLHVLAVTKTSPRRLLHCLDSSGDWTDWGQVENVAGDVGEVADVSVAMVRSSLHVVVTNTAGGVFHAIRYADGSWNDFGNVEGASGSAGTAVDVGVTGRENGELHIVVTNTANQVLHTVRRASGSWTGWGNVEGETGGLPGAPLEAAMS